MERKFEPLAIALLKSQYKEVYGVSDGIVDEIASLRPERELVIWQPEVDITDSPSKQPRKGYR
ncbi:TPA: hypothetical protein ACRNCK_005059 [Pseudomonas aeruginosa]|uniref:hypothetical protein n=1 Tax=Pseudomonas aeruginosa TaxID=287 RepID=UPI00104BF54E|nr:hypothetical protein [Pseudomonas aeruginosa]NPW56344.1 hypothetical protein [Pseudomonas aeruginosa]HCL3371612.1 hypothetical protein [Pseudomonas aeruginosa]